MSGIRARSFLPRTAVLEMTYRCSHRCIYCSCPWEREGGSFDRRPEMSAQEWKRVISELCEAGVTAMAFTGGEALLRDDLLEIILHAAGCTAEHIETVEGGLRIRRAPPDLYLLSNGRLVDDRVLGFCAAHSVRLSLSLPGLATFTRHTGYEGPDMVLERFASAKKRGVVTTANITVTKLNLSELDRTMAAALVAGADQVLLNRFLPGGRGLSHAAELALSPDEVGEMMRVAGGILSRAGRPGSLGTETPFCIADPARYPGVKFGTRCSAAVHFFTIDPSGYVRVCNHSEVRLAHFSEWRSLKDDPYWRIFAFRKHIPAECRGCGNRSRCDAGCREAAHIATGRIDALDPLVTPEIVAACSASSGGSTVGRIRPGRDRPPP
ncbi:radical SAM protein [Candidatus Fermentibacteria bacterium]|nr:radical SAM protein [Candidatus Fermentibacteria bacterium]